MSAVKVLLHTTWSEGSFTWPVGFTVIVNVSGLPGQDTVPFVNVGVTVIVAITGAVPELVAVKDAIFPLPDAGSPMPGAEFVHA